MAKKNVSENKETTAEETVEEIKEEVIETECEKETVEKEKYDELYDKHLRLMAEYDNFKKRTQKEKDELFDYATAGTIEKLLPVIDNLERALESVTRDIARKNRIRVF